MGSAIHACLVLAISSACFGQGGEGMLSTQDFGAIGDGVADDTAPLQKALDAGCKAPNPARIHIPAGTYNLSTSLVTKCALSIQGDSAEATILFQTVARKLNHGIVASYPLTLEDLSINTTPLTVNLDMIAVFSVPASARGLSFRFVRFHSKGFNFGLDINGNGDTDLLRSIVIQDCDIAVNTQPNAVSQPVNAANAEFLSVEDSTLTGDQHDDHALYLISIRKVVIRNNVLRNHDNSAIKLLAGGFGPTAVCPEVHDDYSTWTIENNRIEHSRLAIAAYTYCAVELPEIVITGNRVTDIPNNYAGDAAAIYIQATCQSAIGRVTMSGNVFRDLGLSGVFLLSSIQSTAPCADRTSNGTIRSFSSTGDRYSNWSISYPGDYYAVTSSGPNLIEASIDHMTLDGQGHGRAPLNLGRFQRVKAIGVIELNVTNPGTVK